MTFTKKQSANNVRGKLQAGISASSVALILEPDDAPLFPNHAGSGGTDYFLTLEQRNITGEVIKREIVKVTQKVSNVFTVVRGAGNCPSSDSNKTQGNTSFSFDGGTDVSLNVVAEVVNDIQDEVIRLEQDKADDTDVVKLTGNQTIGGVKTFSSSPQIPTGTNTGDAVNKAQLDAAILGELPESLVEKEVYSVGENVTAGDSLYLENMIPFAFASSIQPVGNVTGNTRVGIPVFGSGTASTTLKLSLRKYGTPGVNLGVRIETDNAGSPSGTLVNANATSTVLQSGLTTSLVDTTVTLAGSITIPKGQRAHIVLFAGTYGSETINATNYFGVGYSLIDTTIRGGKTFNGSVWSARQATVFYYTDSTLFIPKLLVKTDATFLYKLPISVFTGFGTSIPRIAAETKTAGQECIIIWKGLANLYSGLTPNVGYYILNTAGAIGTTAGNNLYSIGRAINETTLLVDGKRGGIDITVLTGSPFSWTNNTGRTVQVKITFGAVSLIVINGVTVATATNHINTVPAGVTMTVTYSIIPVIVYFEL